jgi:hypothetical protein
MKKLFLLVSCFAVMLVLSNVSVAQDAATADHHPAPAVTLPLNYPGMTFGLNPREVRRAVRFDARMASRTARYDAKYAQPALPYGAPAVADAVAVSPAPVAMSQMGPARNVTMRSGPGAVGNVINFLSITRAPRVVVPAK